MVASQKKLNQKTSKDIATCRRRQSESPGRRKDKW